MIHFRPVDLHTLPKILKLEVAPGDEKFVAPNAVSIAQAYVEPRTFPLGIYEGNTPVGFIWYGQYAEDKGDWWVGRLMVDVNHRRKGIGKKAMQLLFKNLSLRSVDKLYLTVVPENSNAIAFYESLGFTNTKKELDREILYVIKLPTEST